MITRKEQGLDAYFYDINRYGLLSRTEEVDLSRLVREKNDPLAREKLIASNLRLVVSVARTHVGRGLPLLDLIEEGNVGLTKAVDHYDPDAGCRFATYATWWIRQAIRKALSDTSRPVRIPSYLTSKIAAWKRKATDLREKMKCEPSLHDVAQACGVSRRNMPIFKSALLTLRSTSQLVSLDGGEDGSMSQSIATRDGVDPADSFFQQNDLDRMREFLKELPERSRRILELRYGLAGEDPLTLREIGDKVNLSRERVRQIEADALATLRQRLEPDEAAA
jgi:RNA polymerase primary sigma factor